MRRPRGAGLVLLVATVFVLVATVVVVAVTATGSTPADADRAVTATSPAPSPTSTCHPTGAALRVVAASGIAPVVRAAAESACLHVELSVDDSEAAASGLRSGTSDVWIPDSRERGYLAVGAAVAAAPTLASSPLVMVAAPQVATAIAGGSTASWGVLLDQTALAPVTVAIQDPATSGASLVLAGELAKIGTTATGDENSGVAAAAGALHALGTVPAAKLPTPAATRIDVVEQRFVQSNADVVQVPTAEGLPVLDFPFVTLPAGAATAPTSQVAADLLTALQGPSAAAARDAAGLLPPGTTSVRVAPSSTSVPLLPAADVSTVPTSLAVADTSATAASVLAVLDVSGSMGDAAPGQQAPIDVVRASAQTFFTTFGQGVDLGLWEFAYRLAPSSDHIQVFPIQPFAASQAQLGTAIAAVRARPSGTALYATTLEAYRTVQAAWKPDSANIVAIFTDGRDEDAPGSIGLPAMIAALQAQADPQRPVQIIFFGYGDADIAAMTAITDVVGGGVYPIAASSDIVGAFIRASGQIAASGP